jgi:hypothetical protein
LIAAASAAAAQEVTLHAVSALAEGTEFSKNLGAKETASGPDERSCDPLALFAVLFPEKHRACEARMC